MRHVRLSLVLSVLMFISWLPGVFGQADGTQKWAFTTLSSATLGSIISSPAVASDGTVYIGVEVGSSSSASPSGRLFAINPNGTQKWVFTAPDWIDSTPCIGSDGTVYFGCWDGKIYALNADGTRKWSYDTGDFISASPSLGNDGTLYIGGGSGNLYAINPDGTLKWTFPTADLVDSSPAIGTDGTLYFGCWDKNIYAIRSDGTEKWRYATGDKVVASPAIAADGSIIVGSRDLNLYVLNPDGSLKWNAKLGDMLDASPVLGADGTIYQATTGGRLFALSATGLEQWRYPRADQSALQGLYSTPAVRSDGSIVFGSSDNALYALKADGTLLWKKTLGDYADSSPLVSPDGSIYIGCYDKKLYAFASTAAPLLTDWAQYHRDGQRTGNQPIGGVKGTKGKLAALSVRTNAGKDSETLIVGFVVTGSGSRSLLVRGVGPSISDLSSSVVLADPLLRLYSGAGSLLASNDNWGQATNAAQIVTAAASVGDFPLASGSLDSAMFREFSPGGYSVHVTGATGGSGIALMETYDIGGSAGARLLAVSARSLSGIGDNILIAGFVVGDSTRTILVRGLGPLLASQGLPSSSVLKNPYLRIYRGSQMIAENDDWSTPANANDLIAAAISVQDAALDIGSKDAALLLTLPPGNYSAHVLGVGDTTGVALVEVYEIP